MFKEQKAYQHSGKCLKFNWIFSFFPYNLKWMVNGWMGKCFVGGKIVFLLEIYISHFMIFLREETPNSTYIKEYILKKEMFWNVWKFQGNVWKFSWIWVRYEITEG